MFCVACPVLLFALPAARMASNYIRPQLQAVGANFECTLSFSHNGHNRLGVHYPVGTLLQTIGKKKAMLPYCTTLLCMF